jgi:hypothetical protein
MVLDHDLEVGKPGCEAARGNATKTVVDGQKNYFARRHSNLRDYLNAFSG